MESLKPPVGFLEPIVSLPASSASSTITAKPKYDSLIKRLNLQAQATAQDLELSCSSTAASPSNPANATGEADSRLRKGKGKMSEEKAWKDMSIKEKKEAMVLDARRYEAFSIYSRYGDRWEVGALKAD